MDKDSPPSNSLDSIDLHPVGEKTDEEIKALQEVWDQIVEVDHDDFLDNGRPDTPMATEDNPVSGIGTIRTYQRKGYSELYDDNAKASSSTQPIPCQRQESSAKTAVFSNAGETPPSTGATPKQADKSNAESAQTKVAAQSSSDTALQFGEQGNLTGDGSAIAQPSILPRPVDPDFLESMQVSDLDLEEQAEHGVSIQEVLDDPSFDLATHNANNHFGALPITLPESNAFPFEDGIYQTVPNDGDIDMDQGPAISGDSSQQGFQRRPNGTFTLGNLIFPFDEELDNASSPLFQDPSQHSRDTIIPQLAPLSFQPQPRSQGQPLTFQNRTSIVRDFAFTRPTGVSRPIPPQFTPLRDGQLFQSPATAAWAAEFHRRNASPGHIVPTAEDFERGRVIAYYQYNQPNDAPQPASQASLHSTLPFDPAKVVPFSMPQVSSRPPNPEPTEPRRNGTTTPESANQSGINDGAGPSNMEMIDMFLAQQEEVGRIHDMLGMREAAAPPNGPDGEPNLLPDPTIWESEVAPRNRRIEELRRNTQANRPMTEEEPRYNTAFTMNSAGPNGNPNELRPTNQANGLLTEEQLQEIEEVARKHIANTQNNSGNGSNN